MKKTMSKLNGNAGVFQVGITLLTAIIMVTYFIFFWGSKVDARIDERINMHPRLETIEEENKTMHLNLKRMMSEFDIEYIE